MSSDTNSHTLAVDLTAQVVSAFVANNHVAAGEIAELISTVYSSLTTLGSEPIEPAPAKPDRIMSVKKSIAEDFLISFEDGRKYKSLKRHLAGHGLTPESYRAKWDLPADYPMVSAGYSKRRSDLAKSIGLGRKAASAAGASKTRERKAA